MLNLFTVLKLSNCFNISYGSVLSYWFENNISKIFIKSKYSMDTHQVSLFPFVTLLSCFTLMWQGKIMSLLTFFVMKNLLPIFSSHYFSLNWLIHKSMRSKYFSEQFKKVTLSTTILFSVDNSFKMCMLQRMLKYWSNQRGIKGR